MNTVVSGGTPAVRDAMADAVVVTVLIGIVAIVPVFQTGMGFLDEA